MVTDEALAPIEHPHGSAQPCEPAPRPASRLRLALAAIGCVIAGLGFSGFVVDDPDVWPLAMPMLLLFGSAALLFRAHLPSQLLVRAVLWSNLVLGTLISMTGGSSELELGAMLAVGSAMGLVSLGRHGLDLPSEDFAPAAFRGSLVLTLVMALADTQSLALFGALHLDHSPSESLPLLACAGFMLVALYGLYHLKLWGLVLNIVANVVIAGLAFTGVLDLPDPIVFALCTTAMIQLALPVPLVVSVVRGKAPTPSPSLVPWRAAVVPLISVSMALMAIYGWLNNGPF